MAQENRIIKTYMSFGLPVDPANVKTLVDLDISYALASTLVDWTDSRKLIDGLAKESHGQNEKEIIFNLRPQAKWSDGSPVTASQVVKSFERAKRLYEKDLKSLFEIIDRIEAKNQSTVLFHLNRPVASSMILHKLTEPMYGVVFVHDDGSIDLKKTSGAFSLKSESSTELTLVSNANWYGHDKAMADSIVIRQPPTVKDRGDQDNFLDDPWPNIVTSTSLMPKERANLYEKEHFSVWNRSLDRVFFLSPSTKLANADGRHFFQTLNKQLDRGNLLRGLAGFHLSQQFFPPGYVIFDPNFKINPSSNPEFKFEVPSKFTQSPLELLTADGRLGAILQQNLSNAIKTLTGHAPRFRSVPLSEFEKERAAGQYDILAASLPVNDPNVEGAVSFFFGMTPPFIPNSGEGTGDFRKRTIEARHLDENKRNIEYRNVFTQAVQDGCILPLFHFSSVVVARNGIDLSQVPTSDESVAFAKIRFK